MARFVGGPWHGVTRQAPKGTDALKVNVLVESEPFGQDLIGPDSEVLYRTLTYRPIALTDGVEVWALEGTSRARVLEYLVSLAFPKRGERGRT